MTLDSLHGAILGTIIGDAMGLPYEALSHRRGRRLLGPADRYRFIFGRGMMSDDGEHTCMVAQSLCVAGADVSRFRRSLAWRLRWWLLGIPAGIGGATLRAILKLWIVPDRSGVFSAGNGPAMRSAIIGACYSDPKLLRGFVLASTRLTHTDPKALHGAMAVAVAARCSAEGASASTFMEMLQAELAEDHAEELLALLDRACKSAAANQSTPAFAAEIGCTRGVSGYVLHTVPVAIHAWLRNPTAFAAAVTDAIECGGDTDTLAAITGGIVGSRVGPAGIPLDWQTGLLEWPRSLAWIKRLAIALHAAIESQNRIIAPSVGPLVVVRNVCFVLVVLVHICRRALPPY